VNEEQNTTGERTETGAQPEPGNSLLIIGVLGAVVVLAGLYYFFVFDTVTAPLEQQVVDSSQSAWGTDYPEVVAVVNGEEVSREDLLPGLGQEMQFAAQQGADVADATVQTQIEANVMNRLINTVLLLQAAKSNGIVVTDEAVTNEYALVVGQFEDVATFEAAIAEQGLTEAQLRAEIHDRLLLDAFFASNTFEQLSVSPEEIQATYDEVAAAQTDLPPLEDVAAEIEAQLLAQKQQAVIGSYIESLRSEATIEVRI